MRLMFSHGREGGGKYTGQREVPDSRAPRQACPEFLMNGRIPKSNGLEMPISGGSIKGDSRARRSKGGP